MININDYLKLTDTANNVVEIYHKNAQNFATDYNKVDSSEIDSIIRHFIINNKPFAFKTKPITYEQITQYIANRLDINPLEIKLIGSGKMGFSISPKKFSRVFSEKSDLDFAIINKKIFEKIVMEFNQWKDDYTTKNIFPKDSEVKYWDENLIRLPRNIGQGFIDTNKIPNRDPYMNTKTVNHTAWFLKTKLEELNIIHVKKVSFRIYKDWDAFFNRVKYNTQDCLNKS